MRQKPIAILLAVLTALLNVVIVLAIRRHAANTVFMPRVGDSLAFRWSRTIPEQQRLCESGVSLSEGNNVILRWTIAVTPKAWRSAYRLVLDYRKGTDPAHRAVVRNLRGMSFPDGMLSMGFPCHFTAFCFCPAIYCPARESGLIWAADGQRGFAREPWFRRPIS